VKRHCILYILFNNIVSSSSKKDIIVRLFYELLLFDNFFKKILYNNKITIYLSIYFLFGASKYHSSFFKKRAKM